jgi:enterochelin esterase-like enzyme
MMSGRPPKVSATYQYNPHGDAHESNWPAFARPRCRARRFSVRGRAVGGTSDGLIGVNRQFKSWLKSKGVEFTEKEVPDMGYVWPLWRQNLTDMVPRLFR